MTTVESDFSSISDNLERLQEARRIQQEADRLEQESRSLATQADLMRRKHHDAIRAGGKWEPMDTAPHDGTVIEILHEGLGVLRAERDTTSFVPYWKTVPNHLAQLTSSSGSWDVFNEERKFVGWRFPSNPS